VGASIKGTSRGGPDPASAFGAEGEHRAKGNSAPDIDALVRHYAEYFDIVGFPVSEQDQANIVAYMNLL
jgi:hypothetical protein